MNSGSAWPVHHCVSSLFYTRWIRRKKPLYRRVIFYCLYCDSQVSVTISIPLLYFFCLECSSSSMVWFPQGGTSCARSLGWAAVPLPTEQWILFCVQEGNCTWQHCSFPPKRWFFCASWDSLQRVLLPGPSLHSSVVLGWLWLRLSPCRTRILVQPCTVEHLYNISSCWCPNMCISHYLGYCFPVLFLLFPTGLTSGGSRSSRALLNIAHVDCFILKSSRAYRGKNTE